MALSKRVKEHDDCLQRDIASLREQMTRLQTEIAQHNKKLDNIGTTLTQPDNGVCVRIIKIETTLSNLKWIIGLGMPILLVLIEVALKELHLL